MEVKGRDQTVPPALQTMLKGPGAGSCYPPLITALSLPSADRTELRHGQGEEGTWDLGGTRADDAFSFMQMSCTASYRIHWRRGAL